MNRRQEINKILHDHIDVNKHEDYTNYKELITAIENWYDSKVSEKNDTLSDSEKTIITSNYFNWLLKQKKENRGGVIMYDISGSHLWLKESEVFDFYLKNVLKK